MSNTSPTCNLENQIHTVFGNHNTDTGWKSRRGNSDFPQCQMHKSKGFKPRLLHECQFCTVVTGFYSRTHTSYCNKRKAKSDFFLTTIILSYFTTLCQYIWASGAVSHFLSWSSFISSRSFQSFSQFPGAKMTWLKVILNSECCPQSLDSGV